MKDESKVFGLASRHRGAEAPVLTSVQASGRLDGVLFELTLRQTYRNTGNSVLEVVYTFPLPTQAVLLGFASELNGQRKVGTVVAKRAAEHQYEQALEQGDAPVMVEALHDGMHTANIGNLKPGDELVLEVRFAQLLAFEQGRLRLAIPTTIAPRYGNPEAAGLQAQQVPHASLLAQYPLTLSVTVAGGLASCTVECPTHRFTRQAAGGSLRLELAADAWLDRDVVIVVTPREALPSLVIQARDTVSPSAPVVVMAALQPPASQPRKHIALKLLVDCSGSMGGDSIASARVALQGALAGLSENDQVSVSRFGSTIEHVLAPSACTPRTLRLLKPAIDAIDANLGGTAMEAALKAVFELPMSADGAGADVLLLTDGEIWQAEEMIAAARASGHRVFAIGVGSSPAEGVLRSLAEATGGACEFATPGEALEAAAARMLARIRQQPWRDTRIDWGCKPVWQTALPTRFFGGDTVIVFAGVAAPTSAPQVRLLASGAQGADIELARGEADAPCPADTLPRIAAARRIATASAAEAQELAVAYQLMTQHTNCILVHERAEADKATEAPELHRVSSMLAAGWGASSTVMKAEMHDVGFFDGLFGARVEQRALSIRSVREGPVWSSAVPPAYADFHNRLPDSSSDEHDASDLPDLHAAELPPASLQAMADAVIGHLRNGGDIQGLANQVAALDLHADARLALEQAVALGVSTEQAWLMLAGWVNGRNADRSDPVAAAALQPALDSVDPTLLALCMALFDRVLGAHGSDRWTLTRSRRLQRAMALSSAG